MLVLLIQRWIDIECVCSVHFELETVLVNQGALIRSVRNVVRLAKYRLPYNLTMSRNDVTQNESELNLLFFTTCRALLHNTLSRDQRVLAHKQNAAVEDIFGVDSIPRGEINTHRMIMLNIRTRACISLGNLFRDGEGKRNTRPESFNSTFAISYLLSFP